MKCPLCNQRKGIRHCPGSNSSICSLCCGTRRRQTITCPDDCAHLLAGRRYQIQRISDFKLLEEIRKLSPDYLNNIEQSILAVRATWFRNLLDREVKEALENLLKTIETAERKIIYEYRSPNPKIQIVAESVKEMIKKQQKGEDALRPVSIEETKACLMAIIITLKSLVKQNPESTIYLDFIHRYNSREIINESITNSNPSKTSRVIY